MGAGGSGLGGRGFFLMVVLGGSERLGRLFELVVRRLVLVEDVLCCGFGGIGRHRVCLTREAGRWEFWRMGFLQYKRLQIKVAS